MARAKPPAVPLADTDYGFEPEPLHDLVRMHFRGIMPPWDDIFHCVSELRLRETFGGALSDSEIADEIYYLDGDYRRGQLFEEHIKANANRSDLPLMRLGGPRNRQNPERGRYSKKPVKRADSALICGASDLLEKMKGRGSNRPIGKFWSAWDGIKEKRIKSTLQKFMENILAIIDPARLMPSTPPDRQAPKSSFYGQAKKYDGFVKARAIKSHMKRR
jgi:hypothetical protein